MGTYTPAQRMKYCRACARAIDGTAAVCPKCGAEQAPLPSATDRRKLPASLLCFFFGMFGAHRFYAGKIGTAFLQLLTLGGLGIWWMIDFIMIVTGSFTDGDGNKITEWT